MYNSPARITCFLPCATRHRAGSCKTWKGSVGCEERIRNRRGIAVGWMPSAATFRSISAASVDGCALSVFSTIFFGIACDISTSVTRDMFGSLPQPKSLRQRQQEMMQDQARIQQVRVTASVSDLSRLIAYRSVILDPA